MSEEIITTAGPFKFINRTKYNSDDIAAMFLRFIEIAREIYQDPALEVKASQYRAGRFVDVYDICDFNPKQVFQKVRTWDNNSGKAVEQVRPDYASEPGNSPSTAWKIGLVPPDRLYSTPLEALSAGTEAAVPVEFKVQLMAALTSRFTGGALDSNYQTGRVVIEAAKEAAKTMELRVMKKRANPTSSDDRRLRVARTRGANVLNGLVWQLGDVYRLALSASSYAESCVSTLRDAEVEIPFTKEELVQIADLVAGLRDRAETFRKELIG